MNPDELCRGYRPEETIAVEMQKVIGHVGQPDFRIPSDLLRVLLESGDVCKGADENQSCL